MHPATNNVGTFQSEGNAMPAMPAASATGSAMIRPIRPLHHHTSSISSPCCNEPMYIRSMFSRARHQSQLPQDGSQQQCSSHLTATLLAQQCNAGWGGPGGGIGGAGGIPGPPMPLAMPGGGGGADPPAANPEGAITACRQGQQCLMASNGAAAVLNGQLQTERGGLLPEGRGRRSWWHQAVIACGRR